MLDNYSLLCLQGTNFPDINKYKMQERSSPIQDPSTIQSQEHSPKNCDCDLQLLANIATNDVQIQKQESTKKNLDQRKTVIQQVTKKSSIESSSQVEKNKKTIKDYELHETKPSSTFAERERSPEHHINFTKKQKTSDTSSGPSTSFVQQQSTLHKAICLESSFISSRSIEEQLKPVVKASTGLQKSVLGQQESFPQPSTSIERELKPVLPEAGCSSNVPQQNKPGNVSPIPSTSRSHNLEKIISKSQKTMACQHCGKTFTHRGDMNKHVRSHTGEQPYSCTICNRKFTHTSNLARHVRVHSGLKPFHCDRCNKDFNRRDKLVLHQKTKRCSKYSKREDDK